MNAEKQLAVFIVGGLLVAKGMQRVEHAAARNTRTDVLHRLHLTRRRWYRRAAGATTVLELAAGAALIVFGRQLRAARDDGDQRSTGDVASTTTAATDGTDAVEDEHVLARAVSVSEPNPSSTSTSASTIVVNR